MKRIYFIAFIAIALPLASRSVRSQEANPDRLTVSFSDPSRPGLLKVNLLHGGISVKAYNGKDVIIEAGTSSRNNSRSSLAESAGLRRLDKPGLGLTIEEENNVMSIGTSWMNRSRELKIQVPAKTNLKLTAMNGGDLIVEGVEGEIEATNMNGPVTLTDVSGSVVAH